MNSNEHGGEEKGVKFPQNLKVHSSALFRKVMPRMINIDKIIQHQADFP